MARTFQVFSPFYFQFNDNGENVFSYEGPHLLGYKEVGIIMQTAAPAVGVAPFATLQRLLAFLQTPAGILFISTHGGEDSTYGGYIAVEAYPAGDDGRLAALTAKEEYVESGVIDSSEIYVGQAGDYNVLNVTSSFFQRKVSPHAIVFIAACYSAALSNAFVNENHQVRDFIGILGRAGIDWFSDGREIGEVIFNDMAGSRNDGGTYSNQSIATVFPYAQEVVYDARLVFDSSAPSAGNLRLYNSPRIVKAGVELDQDMDGIYERPVYSFDAGGGYPYNPGNVTDYPSGGSYSSAVGSRSPVRASLRFSEPMDKAFPDFSVNLIGSDGTTISIPSSAVSWSSSAITNDTWSSTVSIPSTFPDGETRISVRAKRVSASGLDLSNQELDTDGDGFSAEGAVDQSINFIISNVFTVTDNTGREILSDGFASAEGVFVTGPYNAARIVLSGPSQQEATFSIGDSIAATFSPLYEGLYTISAYDAEDNQLNSLSFTNDLTAPWVSLPGMAAAATTETSVTVQAEDYGSGIDRIVLDGPTGSTRTFSGAQTAEAEFSGLSVGAYAVWVYDRAGNSESKFFWVTGAAPDSYGKTQPMLEGEPALIPMPGSGPASYGSVEFIRTLPDGSRYLGVNKTWEGSYLLKVTAEGALAWSYHWEWYSTIDGLETDTSGNAYVLAMGQLHKFTPEGGRTSVTVGEYGSYSYESYRTSNLAVNSALGRVYVYSEVWPDYRLSAYDTSLNLTNYVDNPGMPLVGSIVVDGAGTLWMTGSDLEDRLLAYRYTADLSAATVFSQATELYDSDHDGVYMPTAADPRGGVAIYNSGVFWRITDSGFSAPNLVKIDNYSSFVVDSEGSILAVAENPETNDQSIVKISTDNAYVWEPAYLDIGASWLSRTISISLANAGKLDVAFSNGSAISLSRYAPMASVVSEDGLASVDSIGEDVTIAPVTPETYATALAAVSDAGLLSVTTFYAVASGSGELPLPAQITLTYSTETVYTQDLDPSAIYLFEYDDENGWVYMEDQETDENNNRIRARIFGVARVFAILGEPGDYAAPVAQLSVNGVVVGDGEAINIAPSDLVTITAEDVGYAGIREIVYATDPEFSDETLYESPFSLAEGTHTIYYQAVDNAFNFSDVAMAYINVGGQPGYTAVLSVSSGPIGLPFTITGAGFGTYSAGLTTVLIGGATAPLTLWSTDTIKGTVPGALAAGEHAVAVMRGAEVLATAAPFTVTQPVLLEVSPSSGAIGVPFTITGESFGNYVAGFTRVLLGGATMPLTLWTDTKIQGTIPGTLPVGDYELLVERALNGGVVRSSTAAFSLRDMEAYWLAPSSGPIGMPFTITGIGFGNYSSVYTHVLIGDTTAPLTLWTDSKIQGTIPGSLASGQHPVLVERRTSDGGIMQTSPMTFEVVTVDVASMTPVAGPIGLPFTIYGANFGNYVVGFTRVLIGGTTAPLTLWTADKIQGTIPGALGSGEYTVVVERELNGGIAQSSALAFMVSAPTAYNMVPSSGPIGLPFTINGANFGNYSAAYTGVLINGATVPLTLWTDTQIKGTIPGSLAPGQYPVVVDRRTADGGAVQSGALSFEVVGINVASMTPVAGPIGMPFTIYGGSFGNYSAGYTKVLIGGATCPLTLWTDTKIQGTVPGSLTVGEYQVIVERNLNGGQVQSLPLAFIVTTPVAYTLAPSSGPIGLPFTITGAGFGNYVANYTKVLIGGATAPLTLWTDAKIQGTIPGALAAGDHELYVERSLNGGIARSGTLGFTVGTPTLGSVSPSTAAVIAPFTITGYNFGNYVANYTKVLINGTTCPLTLWTDTKIQGKLPFLLAGNYPVQVQRYLNGGLAESATAYINVEAPVISSMTPVSGAVGTVFSLYGTGFGPYDATIAKVLMGGVQCALSLWTDTQIRGTVPSGLSYGTHTVVAMRGQAVSNNLEFYIPGGYTPSMMRLVAMPAALEFKLGEVYVYPDPAKGGKVPTFHIEVGTADSVKIKVFTVAGQLAHEATLTGSPQAVGSTYAYEYAWTGRIASGVYYYTIEADRAGKKLKAKGKFAVVR